MLRVMRVMLGICAAAMVVVGGAIIYSITSVQGRRLDSISAAEATGLTILCVMLAASIAMMLAATRILRQNAS